MTSDSFILHTTDTSSEESLLVVDAGLEHHNYAVAPSLSEVRQLATFAAEPAGQVVGGAVGRTWGRCCELLQLWVSPQHRSAGLGSRLLSEFESHARTRGCNVFYLTTLSYQAPGFYRKHQYVELAQISGYPNGITKYLMLKTEAS